MKITSIKGIVAGLGLSVYTGLFGIPTAQARYTHPVIQQNIEDTFTKTTEVTPHGISDSLALKYAPKPVVTIQNIKRKVAIVVDLSKNILYHYNDKGEVQNAYLVASGKHSTPTGKGVRVVSHIESYPYSTAPISTKRRKHPWNYGPNAIIVKKLDPRTGVTSQTGEFIHGNNDFSSLGKYASQGCIRMDNEVIKKLAKIIKRGDLILIK